MKKYLRQGLDRHDAVVRAVDECIAKGILEEVLIKNRAEVIDMFLTTFDRKMYEEAMREEGRDEVLEICERLTREKEELSKTIEEMSKENEAMSKENEAMSKIIDDHMESRRIQAERLKEKGISFEDAKEIMEGFSEEELVGIYSVPAFLSQAQPIKNL